MKYYISDLHLGHKNAIAFDNRPFSTLAEMTETIINNWNSVVKKNDEVYILGDMFWSNDLALEVLPKLNGKLYLVKGNHDRLTAAIEAYFVWVKNLVEIVDEDRHVVLCHYPIAHWRNADYGTIHLYGHIHAARDSRPFTEYVTLMQQRGIPYECYNVGCMLPYMNYTPRTLNEIISGANASVTHLFSS